MEEGVLVEWLVQPGQAFAKDQGLYVVESEKAAVEIPAEANGVLLEATAAAGVPMPVGSVVGYWKDADLEERAQPAASAQPPLQAPGSSASGDHSAKPLIDLAARLGAKQRIPVTPLARRIAARRGIDLSRVQGSGPHGRIRQRDLPAASTREAAHDRRQIRAVTPAQRTMARRLTRSKQEIPHFYLTVEANVGQLLALRQELAASFPEQRRTLNHFFLAAVGRALLETPEVNCVWREEGIAELTGSDVGMAVYSERGLVAPVLRDMGTLPLASIAAAADEAIQLARVGKLSAQQMEGGCITVSNAGMHDVSYMASIINPEQSMILGVGSVKELFRPDAQGAPCLRREIGLVLSADHRVLDGVTALRFLKRIVTSIEQPLRLLLA